MIKKEDRHKPYFSHEFIGHLCGIRGKTYFPHTTNLKERYDECIAYFLDPNKSVIIPDNRGCNSTHICMFINKSGENIAIPLGIDEKGKISLITIKDIAKSEQKPDWFYNNYNQIASSRGMPLMKRIWRP